MTGKFIQLGDQYAEIVGGDKDFLLYIPMDNINKSREKITIETKIDSERLYDDEYGIDEYIDKMYELRERGTTHIRLREESGYDGPEMYFDAVARRLETDKEYADRMEKLNWIEKQETEKREAEERAEFERLKKKFSTL